MVRNFVSPEAPAGQFFRRLHQKPSIAAAVIENCPISRQQLCKPPVPHPVSNPAEQPTVHRSEEHTSELQSRSDLVCRLLLEKKKKHCAQAVSILIPTYALLSPATSGSRLIVYTVTKLTCASASVISFTQTITCSVCICSCTT